MGHLRGLLVTLSTPLLLQQTSLIRRISSLWRGEIYNGRNESKHMTNLELHHQPGVELGTNGPTTCSKNHYTTGHLRLSLVTICTPLSFQHIPMLRAISGLWRGEIKSWNMWKSVNEKFGISSPAGNSTCDSWARNLLEEPLHHQSLALTTSDTEHTAFIPTAPSENASNTARHIDVVVVDSNVLSGASFEEKMKLLKIGNFLH